MHAIRGRLAALLLAVSAVVAGTVAPAEAGQHDDRRGWTGTWATAPSEHYDVSGMSEVTVRMPVHTSVGGSAVRIRLTNAYATDPVTIGHATVGLRDGGAAVARPYDLRFDGKRAVTIPAGGDAVSDPVGLAVPALADLVVSLHLPGQVTHITDHWWAQQTVYWTDYGAGDHAADTAGDAFTWTTTSWPFLSGVDVTAPRAGSVVALGDSITDGSFSTADTNQRWPDLLSARLNACRPGAGVLNAGITGNRITAGTATNPSALDRLDRDVLSQPGARTLILFEGINDLGGASAEQIIAGMTEIAGRAHQRRMRVVGATITPYKDFTWGGWTEETEARRQQVNAFVRDSGGVFDDYADFDRAVRDPADPRRLGAAYDSGDHLHPSDTGMKAFADAVDLTTLGAARDCPSARVRLTPYRPTLQAGGDGTEITSTVTNAGPTAVTRLTTRLDLPDGWTAEPAGSVRVRTLAPGESASVTWAVTPAADESWGTHPIGVRASYRQDGRVRHDNDSVDATVAPVPSTVQLPYLTTATTTEEAQYAQNGGQFAIWAGGQDLSGWKDEKAAVHLADAAPSSGTVTARVAGQSGSGPSAKAGIAVANDLTAPEAGGYAVLTMSAQFGLEFLTDSDGDGRLDTWAGGGSSYHPAWLKLVRDGTAYTAYASSDGTAWQQVAAAIVPSASGTGDAGMVASAVNLNHPGQTTTALFDSFSAHV